MPRPREPMWRRYLRFFGPNVEADFDEEVAFHLSERVAELEGQGLDATAARQVAEAEFGDLGAARRTVAAIDRRAEARRRPWLRFGDSLGSLLLDFRVALRGLRANPSLVVAAVLSLGVAIAVNVVVLAATDAVVWRPFSVPNMDRLVRVSLTNTARGWTGLPVSWADFSDLRAQAKTVQLVAANGVALNWQRGEESELLRGVEASAGYFAAHGVAPMIGREFVRADEASGVPIAILGERVWRDHFGADPRIVGQQINLDGLSRTIVGVIANGYDFFPWLPGKDVWVPIDGTRDQGRAQRYLMVFGGFPDGRTVDEIQAELGAIGARLSGQYPETGRDLAVAAILAIDSAVQETARTAFRALMVAFSLVLLLASANVANVIMARTTARSRELALRSALGAPGRRIVRLLAVEAAVLAVVGCLAGIGLSLMGISWLNAILGPNDLGDPADIQLSWRVVGLGLLLSLLAASLFGLLPALRNRLGDLVTALRDGGRTVAGSRGRGRSRAVLIAVELGLAALLLTMAGTTITAGRRLANVPVGFRALDGVSFYTYLSPRQYGDSLQVVAFSEQLAARLREIPDVASVGYASGQPIEGASGTTYAVVGETPTAEPPYALRHFVSSGYFDALGLDVLGGRPITGDDRFGASRVIVVNEALARRHWPTASPLGKRLRIRETDFEIVGVVPSVRAYGVHNEAPPALYVPAAQLGIRSIRFFVRSGRVASDLEAAVRSVARRDSPGQPLAAFVTMRSLAERATREPRAIADLFFLLGIVSVLLAIVGVYGVASYTTAAQTPEIGIRRALGATGRHIAMVVGRTGGRAAVVGIAIGALLTIPAGRGMAAAFSLYQVRAFDPGILAGALALLGVVLLAGFALPARRAVQVSALDALKRE